MCLLPVSTGPDIMLNVHYEDADIVKCTTLYAARQATAEVTRFGRWETMDWLQLFINLYMLHYDLQLTLQFIIIVFFIDAN